MSSGAEGPCALVASPLARRLSSYCAFLHGPISRFPGTHQFSAFYLNGEPRLRGVAAGGGPEHSAAGCKGLYPGRCCPQQDGTRSHYLDHRAPSLSPSVSHPRPHPSLSASHLPSLSPGGTKRMSNCCGGEHEVGTFWQSVVWHWQPTCGKIGTESQRPFTGVRRARYPLLRGDAALAQQRR